MNHSYHDDCKTAPLHLVGHIQPHGALALVDRASGKLLACSENLGTITGLPPPQMLDQSFADLVPAPLLAGLRVSDGQGKRRLWHTPIGGEAWLVSAFFGEERVLLEFEKAADSNDFDINQRFTFLDTVSSFREAQEVAEYLLDCIATISGFERVMLYRFLPNWDGKVVAERLKPGIEGFLNHHFPASDLPENARRLYRVNHQRLIADTESVALPILTSDPRAPVDLTYSQLRAVHPVHIQYLRNMQVRSSFSVSVLATGELWGLITCHNSEPRLLGFGERFLCEELSRIASLQMSALHALSHERERSRLQLELHQIENIVSSSTTPFETFTQWLDTVLRILGADSILIRFGDKRIAHGPILHCTGLRSLRRWLRQQPQDESWYHERLPDALAGDASLATHAAGMLFVPLGDDNGLLLLRDELGEELVWAGDRSEVPDALTPRASFESWKESVHGMAQPWSEPQLQEAARFGRNLELRLDNIELERLALEDELTGLLNRRGFEQELETFLELHTRRKASCAVLLLDLDRFKSVNDRLGHAAGDELLQQVSERLRGLLRTKDTIARLGGDEFAIVQYHVQEPPDVALVAERIVAELHRPFQLEEGEAEIGASVGVALFPRHGRSPESLLERADSALYAVKHSGRNGWRLWEEGL